MFSRLRRVVSTVLVVAMISMSFPANAVASIYELPDEWATSSTNPGEAGNATTTWREGWGNKPLVDLKFQTPEPIAGLEPAIVGAHYYLTRPGASYSTTLPPWPWWDGAEHAPMIPNQGEWNLKLDVPTVHNYWTLDDTLFPYFDPTNVYPAAFGALGVTPNLAEYPYEGPYALWLQYHTTDATAVAGGVGFGLDMTPPDRVENPTITVLPQLMGDDGWYTQSYVKLRWADLTYDDLAGTGYFEAFLDGLPYPMEVYPYPTDSNDPFAPVVWPSTPVTMDTPGRRVFDGKEHFPGYGVSIPTARSMTIEDLPPGSHTLQVRAVDRAQNKGPLSSPVSIKVDPDIPVIRITSPQVSGQLMGARPTFSVDATDQAGIREVGFFVHDGVTESAVGTVSAAPYSITSTETYTHGARYTLRAVAVDMAGRTKSDTREFVVDNRPTIAAVTPASNGLTFGRLVPLRAMASDKSGIATMTIEVAGQPAQVFSISGEPTSTGVTTWSYLPSGSHAVTMTAENVTGVSASVTRTFAVSDAARPVVGNFATLHDTGVPGAVAGWFNESSVAFTAEADSSITDPVETLYRVDRSAMTGIDVTQPWLYEASYGGDLAQTGGVVDLNGVYLANPALDGRSIAASLAADPLEGFWYVHSLLRDASGAAGNVRHTVYGIDLTPPSSVSGVGVYSSTATDTPLVSGSWIAQSRVVVKWSGAQVDALSGADHFNVYLDGEALPDAVPFRSTGETMSLTIEDLGPGAHEIAVSAVDAAGNEGPLSTGFDVIIDTAPPIVTITAPASDGQAISLRPILSADASDESGIGEVRFYVDSVLVGTDDTAPYQVSADLGVRGDGSTGMLSVEAEDIAGKVTTAVRPFTVSNRPGLTLLTPAPGLSFSTLVPFKVSASDMSGVDTITITVDDVEVASYSPDSPEPTSTVFSALSSFGVGSHDVTVTAANVTGGSASLNSSFTVSASARPDIATFITGTQTSGTMDFASGWYNTAYPAFTARPGDSLPGASEMLYLVDRAPMTEIDPLRPWEYYAAFRLDGTTHFNGLIDQRGVYLSDPGLFNGASQMPEPGVINDPIEGVWYSHALMRDASGADGGMVHAVYGVDLTPPSSVASIGVYANNTTETVASGWLDQSRVVIKWDGAEVDALSGTDRFNVYVDGVPLGSSPVAFQPGRSIMSVTIEDLPQGMHDISVSAVDKAGNEGPRVSTVARITSIPTVTITSPAHDGVVLMTPTPIRATVTDVSGIASVTASLAETSVVVDFPVPYGAKTYSASAYVPYLSDDTTYTLTFTAKSISGTVTTATVEFQVDTTLPPEIPDDPDPGGGGGPVVTTAFAWYNTTFPTFMVEPSSDTTAVPTELLYLIDRTEDLGVPIDPLEPNAYYGSFRPAEGTTHMNGVIDQVGVYLTEPVAFSGDATGSPTQGKVDEPYEGIWHIHAALRYGLEATATASPVTNVAYGVDVTDPPVVSTLGAYVTTSTPAPAWMSQNRVVLKWDSVFDRLSGTHHYNVYVDGELLEAGDGILHQPGRTTMSLTIEDLAPGAHSITIAAVDSAGNEGPLSAPVPVGIDFDAPTLLLTAPDSSVTTLGVEAAFAADATDDSGVANVTFALTGEASVVDTSAPYTADFDLWDATDGASLVATVTATDLSGKTTVVTDSYTFVNAAPTVVLTAPESSVTTVGTQAAFAAEAADDVGVASVTFALTGEASVVDTTAPYEADFDLWDAHDGDVLSLVVTATDVLGKTGSVTYPYTVVNAPVAQILSPEAGVYSRLVPFKLSGSDPSGITDAVLEVPGQPDVDPAITPGATSIVFDSLAYLAPGSHTATLTVTAASGNTTVVTRPFTVSDSARPELDDFRTGAAGTLDVVSRWFNTANPTFSVLPVSTLPGATHMLYTADREPATVIDASRPFDYDTSYRVTAGTTHFSGVIDLLGLIAENASFDLTAEQPALLSEPAEGVWYTHALMRDSDGVAGPQQHAVFGVDLTDPAVVTGVATYRSATSATPILPTDWLDQTRVVVKWSGAEVDALSGTDRYKVYVDGTALTEPVAFRSTGETMSLTIEDLAPGAHSIAIAAVDAAGNEGPLSAAAPANIVSIPTVTITSPAHDGVVLMTPTPIRATVTDVSGIASVTASLAETSVVVDFPVPYGAKTYSASAYVPYLSDDTTYTLTFTAKSISGTVTTATVEFQVDTTLPPEIPDDPDPGGGGGPVVTTAFAWYNTTFPTFMVEPSSDTTAVPTELLYLIDRTEDLGVPIDPLEPNAYYGSFRPAEGTTHMNGVIDQVGVYLTEPVTFSGDATGSPTQGKVDEPYEGIWHIHAALRYGLEATATASPVTNVAYGVDVTDPPVVSTLGAYVTTSTPAPAWMSQNRVVLKWDSVFDRLSGTHHYNVYVDGELLEAGDGILHQPGRSTMSLTIEDLAPGAHSITIAAVDSAGNEGPLSAPVPVGIDFDAPTLLLTAPDSSVTTLGVEAAFAADATDDSGVASVTFALTGEASVVDTTAPYTADFDLADKANGALLTLTVTATDLSDKTTVVTDSYSVVNAPVAQILSPEAGHTYSRLVPLKAAATDPTGISSAVLDVPGSPDVVAPVAPGATTVVFDGIGYFAPGSHTATLTVTAASGNTTVVTRPFTVSDSARPELDDFRTGAAGTLDVVSRWFNTANPTFSVLPVSTLPGATHMLYTADREPATVIDASRPFDYDTSYRVTAGTTHFSGVIDLLGLIAENASFDLTAEQPALLSEPAEGVWYTHALMRDSDGVAGPQQHAVFGVDLTDPAVVTGVATYRSATSATPILPTDWLDQTRVVVKWSGAEVDALSGTDRYKVYVDGTAPTEPVAFRSTGETMSLTIEDLAPGAHSIAIAAVDAAGNEGPLSAAAPANIVSIPTVTITSPASVDATVSTPAPLRATTMDAAGIVRVEFSIDETPVAQTFLPAAPGAKQLVSSMYAPLPTGHFTLRVTAYSVSGPVTVVTRTFNVDSTLPPEIPTDPDDGGGPVVTPTFTWFNTSFPTFSAEPSDVPTDPTELLYLVDRTPVTPIDPTDPNSYYASTSLNGTTYFDGLIDQQGVYLSNPNIFDGALQMPGRVTSPLEGVWYIHALVRDALGAGSDTAHVAYGVDLTKPLQVGGVGVFSSIEATVPATSWLDQSRAVIRWDSDERDALSGTAYFRVYVDGEVVGEDGVSMLYQPGRTEMALTVENLSPGQHSVQVSAVDKAGNEGPLSSRTYARVDSVLPEVTILTPAENGTIVGLSQTLSALAEDSAGVASVNFSADGVNLGTLYPSTSTTRFSASLRPNWANVPAGTRTVAVRVTDVGGHTATATRTVVLDKTAPVLSSVSGTPSLFYPRIRDGYRDNYYVKFASSEVATATLVVRNSRGATVRVLRKRVSAGSTSIVWNGRNTAGDVSDGTFRWTLQLTDVAGNRSVVRSGSTTIRFYQIIRTGTSSVRVVAR